MPTLKYRNKCYIESNKVERIKLYINFILKFS